MGEEIACDREDEELVNPEGESRVNKTTASCSPQQTSLSGPPIAKATVYSFLALARKGSIKTTTIMQIAANHCLEKR